MIIGNFFLFYIQIFNKYFSGINLGAGKIINYTNQFPVLQALDSSWGVGRKTKIENQTVLIP
jgi:hypothetical protein